MNTLLIYAAWQYSMIASKMIVEAYKEDYPYMSGYGMALMLPDFHEKRVGVASGLLSNFSNEGAIIREVEDGDER